MSSTTISGTPLSPQHYDRTTILLHWAIALAIIMQWGVAHVIDWFPKGPLRIDVRSLHILIGVCLSLALIYRLYWRASQGVRFTPAKPVLDGLARAVHYLLYALLTATLGLGIFNTWLRGDNILGLFHIPKFGSYDTASRHAFAEQIVGYHSLASNALLVLAGGHALVGLIHHFILRDGVLRRMLPKLRSTR